MFDGVVMSLITVTTIFSTFAVKRNSVARIRCNKDWNSSNGIPTGKRLCDYLNLGFAQVSHLPLLVAGLETETNNQMRNYPS